MVILDMYYIGINNININYYTLFIEQSNRMTYFSEMYQITTTDNKWTTLYMYVQSTVVCYS